MWCGWKASRTCQIEEQALGCGIGRMDWWCWPETRHGEVCLGCCLARDAESVETWWRRTDELFRQLRGRGSVRSWKCAVDGRCQQLFAREGVQGLLSSGEQLRPSVARCPKRRLPPTGVSSAVRFLSTWIPWQLERPRRDREPVRSSSLAESRREPGFPGRVDRDFTIDTHVKRTQGAANYGQQHALGPCRSRRASVRLSRRRSADQL